MGNGGRVRKVITKNRLKSEAWGRPQFQEKRSWSEKAILGALGEFRGILGAALGVQKIILGMGNPILGRASHDLSNTEPQFSEQLSEQFPELMGTRPKDFHLPLHSRSVFSRIGVVPACQIKGFFGNPPRLRKSKISRDKGGRLNQGAGAVLHSSRKLFREGGGGWIRRG